MKKSFYLTELHANRPLKNLGFTFEIMFDCSGNSRKIALAQRKVEAWVCSVAQALRVGMLLVPILKLLTGSSARRSLQFL